MAKCCIWILMFDSGLGIGVENFRIFSFILGLSYSFLFYGVAKKGVDYFC